MKRRRRTSGARAAILATVALTLGTGFGTAWEAGRGTGGGTARAEESGDANEPVVAENRWALVFDASRPNGPNGETDGETSARIEAARAKFRADLEASGILPDHIFVYTTTAEDAARRPTREAFANVLEALRDVDDVCALCPENGEGERPYWREVLNDDGETLCEVQIYLAAPAFTAADGRDWLVPCDAPLENLEEAARAGRLASVAEIEDALTRPNEGTTPIQRAFLAINFLTIKETTRGGSDGAIGDAANEVDLERSVARSFSDEDAPEVSRYQYVRVATKNERWDARTVDSFYQTMSAGLEGCADLAGDRDGWVEAAELAEYARANGRDGGVAIARNGNAVYSLCPARREWSVPIELFREIERTFTRPEFKELRDSAKARRERAEARRKGAAK